MDRTRRGFLKAAVTAAGSAAGAATAPGIAQGQAHQAVPSDLTLRVKSLESLLVEKGLVDRQALDALIDTYEHKIGPRNGARVVARAWVDPAYKQRLLTDADAAIAELGYGGMQGEHMVVAREHAEAAQPGRLHAVLLLSVAGARTAARLVQVGAVSLARR